MKQISLMIASLLISASALAFPIEGRWGTTMNQNGFTFDMTFTFQNNSVTLLNTCTYMGRSARAQVSVPARYDASNLEVLGSAEDRQSNDGVNCNANVRPGRLTYTVQGNSLILQDSNEPQPLVLNRR